MYLFTDRSIAIVKCSLFIGYSWWGGIRIRALDLTVPLGRVRTISGDGFGLSGCLKPCRPFLQSMVVMSRLPPPVYHHASSFTLSFNVALHQAPDGSGCERRGAETARFGSVWWGTPDVNEASSPPLLNAEDASPQETVSFPCMHAGVLVDAGRERKGISVAARGREPSARMPGRPVLSSMYYNYICVFKTGVKAWWEVVHVVDEFMQRSKDAIGKMLTSVWLI